MWGAQPTLENPWPEKDLQGDKPLVGHEGKLRHQTGKQGMTKGSEDTAGIGTQGSSLSIRGRRPDTGQH